MLLKERKYRERHINLQEKITRYEHNLNYPKKGCSYDSLTSEDESTKRDILEMLYLMREGIEKLSEMETRREYLKDIGISAGMLIGGMGLIIFGSLTNALHYSFSGLLLFALALLHASGRK